MSLSKASHFKSLEKDIQLGHSNWNYTGPLVSRTSSSKIEIFRDYFRAPDVLFEDFHSKLRKFTQQQIHKSPQQPVLAFPSSSLHLGRVVSPACARMRVKFIGIFGWTLAPIEASVGLGKISRVDIHKMKCEKSRPCSSGGALWWQNLISSLKSKN